MTNKPNDGVERELFQSEMISFGWDSTNWKWSGERYADNVQQGAFIGWKAARAQSAEEVGELVEALIPFAERPAEAMDKYSCHLGITTKEKCGRCGPAIKAFEALTKYKENK